MKRSIKRSGILFAVILLLSLAHTAFAASPYGAMTPDYDKSCKITVTVRTSDGDLVPGGSLALHTVALLKDDGGSPAFFYTGDFGSGEKVSDADLSDLASFASDLSGTADPESSSAVRKDIGSSAVVSFSGLPAGLYLLTQPRSAAGYEELLPVVIMLPQAGAGSLSYDVSVWVKPSEKIEKVYVDPPIRKRIELPGGVAPAADELFTFKMTPEKPDYPMPFVTDATDGSATMTRLGGGEVEFGIMEYGPEHVGKTYRYTLEEIPGTNPDYKYDSNKFYIVVTISLDAEGHLKADSIRYDIFNQPVDEIVITNVYNGSGNEEPIGGGETDDPIGGGETVDPTTGGGIEDPVTGGGIDLPPTDSGIDVPPTGSGIGGGTGGDDSGEEDIDDDDTPLANLPQTGQLWWPVWLMALLGGAFFLSGLVIRKSCKDE